MRKIVEHETLFRSPEFWNFYIYQSCGEIGETFEPEIIEDIFKVEKKSYEDWWKSFTGYYEGIFEETDGDVENPSTICIRFKNNISLAIEFHAGDTYYSLEDKSLGEFTFLGNTGPHWSLPMLRWKEASKLAEAAKPQSVLEEIQSFIILLLLPCIWITKDDDIEEINKILSNAWLKIDLINAEDAEYLSNFWCESTDARKHSFYWYLNDDNYWVTNAKWSSRYEKQPEEQINKIAKLLSLACDK